MNEVVETPFLKNACPEILNKYGLWIFKYHEAYSAPAHKPGIFRYYRFYSLSHLTKGKGWFCSENIKMKTFDAGHAVLVSPGTKQGYGGFNSDYIEDAVCFFGPVADRLKTAGIIQDGVVNIGLTRQLLPIINLVRIPAVNSQLKANMLLQQLLMDIYLQQDEKSKGSNSSDRIKQVLDKIHDNPQRWWLVGEMAELANLSLPQFRRLFQKQTGISPKAYIMQLKMKATSEDIMRKEKSINKIALKYGFKDSYHFSNFFKKLTGYSPTEFRNKQPRKNKSAGNH
ncbi:MAG: helix-turn-helix transcriptional regulator [Victivallaceae bacterium]|nr:helix-turn-helix transcriptional regulator [Victivallaceae bacterium]